MKPIKILTDSTCDLSPEQIQAYDIGVLPLIVMMGEDARLDGVEVSPDEVYDWANKNGKVPSTSTQSPDAIEAFLKQYIADYDCIMFPIGSELSSSYANVCAVAETFTEGRVKVIDSKNLSTGIGLQVLTAARMARNGASFEEIVEYCESIVDKVRAGFIVEDVLYLHKGGRCSALAAWGATALKLRPTLAVVDGKIKVDKKVRGDIRSASMKYATGLEEGMRNALTDMVFITHAGASQEVVDDFYAYVKSLNIFKEIYVTRAGCVISSHCGAGTIGILFISK